MKTSNIGISLIKSFESFSATSYLCPSKILTIGYGHTGSDVKPNMTITESRGVELLIKDLAVAENAINKHVTEKINQFQYDALVSFVFNVGTGAFIGSTLLHKLNSKDIDGASNEFLKWTHGAGGKVLPGLVRRREAERNLFLGNHG